MNSLSPQQCARIAIQKLINLTAALAPPYQSRVCKWKLLTRWGDVIEYTMDIHNWTIENYSGAGLDTADIANKELTDVLRELQLSSWQNKMVVRDLGRKRWTKYQVYRRALSRSEVRPDTNSEAAFNLIAMLEAAYSKATSDCPDILVIPISA